MNVFVMVPTYNEADVIKELIDAIFLNLPQCKVLVVDDNSPDGTGTIVTDIAKNFPEKVFLLTRTEKKGRGFAGIDGFRYALEQGADAIIEMDADFSHNPKYLPELLREIDDSDVVIGSRLVQGGQDKRGFKRKILTSVGNWVIRKILGLKVQDCSSGYRLFKAEVLEKINLETLISPGPSIVEEIIYKSALKGFKIKEIPIIFIDRKVGYSKLGTKLLFQVIFMIFVFKFIFSEVWEK